MGRSKKMILWFLAAMMVAAVAAATMQQDEQECADQIANLADCIPFVSGTAKKPTQKCCDDTRKVKSAKPKCLCVLIKESTDPSMGLPINTTLALQMPSACNIDAKASDCPSLLNLSPDSPDAKIFKDAGAGSSTTDSNPTTSASTTTSSSGAPSSSSSSSSSSGTGSSSDTKATPSNNGVAELSGSLVLMMGLALAAAWMVI